MWWSKAWLDSLRCLLVSVTSVTLLVTARAEGQSPVRELGLKFGVSSSSVKWQTAVCDRSGGPERCQDGIMRPAGRRRSATVGIWARWGLGASWLSLQTEVAYEPKGLEISSPRLHLDYLEFPVLLRADIAPRDTLRVFFGVGMAPAAEIRCSVADARSTPQGNYVAWVGDCDQTDRPLFTQITRGWDLGLAIEGGLTAQLGPGAVSLEARATLGWIEIQPKMYNDRYAIWLAYSPIWFRAAPDSERLRERLRQH